jgi:hypothetical protein
MSCSNVTEPHQVDVPNRSLKVNRFVQEIRPTFPRGSGPHPAMGPSAGGSFRRATTLSWSLTQSPLPFSAVNGWFASGPRVYVSPGGRSQGSSCVSHSSICQARGSQHSILMIFR